jgi:hypothetical protein
MWNPFEGFTTPLFYFSGGGLAEDAAAEDFAHQRPPDGPFRDIMETTPHASPAEYERCVVRDIRPGDAPYPFGDAALRASIDYVRCARHCRFDNSHGSSLSDRSGYRKSHSRYAKASAGRDHLLKRAKRDLQRSEVSHLSTDNRR